MSDFQNIVAVVVTYNPNLDALQELLNATKDQVGSIIVVDNSSDNFLGIAELLGRFPSTCLLKQQENFGIAHAQNIGIEKAITRGADYILLLDQDSVPQSGMVEKLLSKCSELKKNGQKIAAAGPICLDPRSGIKSYFMTTRFGIPYRYDPSKYFGRENDLITAAFLISSGTLLDVGSLKDIGGKRSDYFIDHVDTEWCLRARSKGYLLLGVHDARMWHSIGDEVKKFWLFYNRNVPYHSPLRDYYMFRNTILVNRDIKAYPIWRLLLIYRLIQFMVYFLIFAPQRILRVRCMLMGIYHGLKSEGGRLDLISGACLKIPRTSIEP